MGIPAYLMDFGFGGFLGYGKGVPVRIVVEELKKGRCMKSVAFSYLCQRKGISISVVIPTDCHLRSEGRGVCPTEVKSHQKLKNEKLIGTFYV